MKPNDSGRGMLIHIRNGIDFQEQNTDPAVLEIQVVDLKLGDVKICLMSVYRSRSPQPKITLELTRKSEPWEKAIEYDSTGGLHLPLKKMGRG